MDSYARLVRPLLFRLDPERAHDLARALLRSAWIGRLLGGRPTPDPRLAVRLGSLRFPNPVGLAPGFDKDALLTAGMSRLGFGYLVAGTVMPRPRPGNPRPRMLRREADQAIVNCMGLPSRGLEPCAEALARRRSQVPVVASFGAPDDDGLLKSFQRLQPLADALEVNQRCANNPDDAGGLQEAAAFEPLLKFMAERKTRPLRVKLDSYVDERQRAQRLTMLELLIAYGIDGAALPTNHLVPEPGLSRGCGNIAGGPLLERTLDYVRLAREASNGRIAIHARGGIFTGAQAFEAIAAGASTVEIYSAFIYRGWEAAKLINLELLAVMAREGVDSVEALRGARARRPAEPVAEAGEADFERVLARS